MTKYAQNTFEKGLQIDNEDSLQEAGTYTNATNIDIAEIGEKLAAVNIKGSNLAANITNTISTDNSIEVLGAYRTNADIDRGSGFEKREGIILFVKGSTPPPPAQALQPIVSPDAGIYSGFVAVTVTNQRAGETIYYTTDGSEPTQASNIYGGIIVLNSTATLRLRAFSPIVGVAPSEITTVSYVISALSVTISPAAGTYLSSRSVSLASSSGDAVIYYTVDGSTPDETSDQYTSPFTLTENTTVKAIAIITGISTSAIATSVFGIQLIAPELTASGTEINSFEFSANNPNSIGEIRYTIDGSTPNSGSTLYVSPVTLTATTNVKAAVFNSTNVTSDVTDRTYTVQCDAPVLSPSGGIIDPAVPITMTTTTSGATIRYTTNGDEPTGASTAYSTPVYLTEDTTVKAKTFKSGLTDSDTTSSFYSVPFSLWIASIRNAGNGRIYASSNKSATWSELRPLGNTNQDWEAVGGFDTGAAIFAQLGSTLYRSADKGATWSTVTSPNDNAFANSFITFGNPNSPLQIQRGGGGTKMVMVGGNINPAQSNLFLSTNSGASFTAIPVPPCGNVWTACVLNNGWIIACALSISTFGVYRTKDDGASWQEVIAPIFERRASRLIAVGNEVYLPLRNFSDSPSGTYYSSNGGDSFSLLTWGTNLELYQKANNNRMIAIRNRPFPNISITRYSDDNFTTPPAEVDPISSQTSRLNGLAANSEGYVLVHDSNLLALSSDNGLTYTTIYPQGGTQQRGWYGLAMFGEI